MPDCIDLLIEVWLDLSKPVKAGVLAMGQTSENLKCAWRHPYGKEKNPETETTAILPGILDRPERYKGRY